MLYERLERPEASAQTPKPFLFAPAFQESEYSSEAQKHTGMCMEDGRSSDQTLQGLGSPLHPPEYVAQVLQLAIDHRRLPHVLV